MRRKIINYIVFVKSKKKNKIISFGMIIDGYTYRFVKGRNNIVKRENHIPNTNENEKHIFVLFEFPHDVLQSDMEILLKKKARQWKSCYFRKNCLRSFNHILKKHYEKTFIRPISFYNYLQIKEK